MITQGQPIMLGLKSKDTVFNGIRKEYRSFPNVICDNFFDQLSERIGSCMHQTNQRVNLEGSQSENSCQGEDRWPDFKGGGQEHRNVVNDQNQHKIICFELFCVHLASQIRYRRQILIDAKKLASRLWYLCRIKGT